MRRAAIVASLAALAGVGVSAALIAGPSAATASHERAAAGDHARAGDRGRGGDRTRGKRKTERVKVADDYFSPTTLKVKPRTKVKWKWDPDNLDTHDVVLKKGPKGVDKKDYRSGSGSIGVKFAVKFKRPGKYNFICTFHRSVMKMTVKVKNKKKHKGNKR